MALHELASNTVVSDINGKTAISWYQEESESENSTLKFVWNEPLKEGVKANSEHKGFGSMVLNFSVPTALNGLSDLRIVDSNVVYELEAPMSSLV
jgi:two-component sensor histidine kinase